MKRGFTLLEVLVASVLMGMLVTILTMIFNQSAIAWRTGKAGVADMNDTELNLARIRGMADDVLPYTGGKNYCVVSPWDDARSDDSRSFNPRGALPATFLRTGAGSVSGSFYSDTADPGNWSKTGLGTARANGGKAWIVGVRSYGPDREPDTEDDISTWPEDVQ